MRPRKRGETARRSAKDKVRELNRRVFNPLMLRLAGRRHWYAAVIRHVGRRTGRSRATPVIAVRVEDGFVVPLPYGTAVDWLRNVLATGRATLDVKGEHVTVVAPRVVDAATALPLLSSARRRIWRLFGIEHFLLLSVEATTP
ncbi:nitroreductase family deazaflavin-dependent oxidoreductase [Saccharothrix variisporea]|uniref:Deazaflavin-dependent oxidoreductase (Nitroreductase family) n=1 Tax=Saccharothrix variisporea TaxID=543527 RepID=A0A495XKA0_9PSEU|nr:nitroreductase family deazaflavin-dependent oxidoreductase [Saccharothrix variisporea]RKT74537.1 deazaflavin-dependent oxidoreductase (nitroreductase family) [Saccharothrix variisporea]